eukprot:CAMPEP_0205816572 /NCGR_PEP_ID=MMETSP0205-20121125/22961_1 /ASSEMBLY_ACC=CAM_ASM_000278 /TAXON_ID=36767 /ORGANISM="Euplotes focardii, Strain TN1" /LENGTH=69 /DNA_ID=CAMNT_0053105255 /DNA_START=15 /DNA_END=221 /DNA_ORIENTATION=+
MSKAVVIILKVFAVFQIIITFLIGAAEILVESLGDIANLILEGLLGVTGIDASVFGASGWFNFSSFFTA